MSAFILGEYHLQVLIGYAYLHDAYIFYDGKRYDVKREGIPDLLLKVLHCPNIRSVNARYSEEHPPEDLRFNPPLFNTLTPVQILKACSCYEYQACETSDYHQTFANEIIDRIRRLAIHRLDGYDAAEWELVLPAVREENGNGTQRP